MPILDVEIVTRPGEQLPGDLAAAIAEQAAGVFGSPPQQTWVKLRALGPGMYAENGGAPEGAAPVFVSVLRAQLPAPEPLAAEAAALTAAVAEACGRPAELVHVVYLPSAAGRAAFGGLLVRG